METTYKQKNLAVARAKLAHTRALEDEAKFHIVKVKVDNGVALSFDDYYIYFGKDACAELCDKCGISMAMFYQFRKKYRNPSIKLAKKFIANSDGHFTLNAIFLDSPPL
jgi:hypothetical protein